MNSDDAAIIEQARKELIALREARMLQIAEERKALLKQIFLLTKIPGSLTRLPGPTDVNLEQLNEYVDSYPMTNDAFVSHGQTNTANLPPDEFLIGAPIAPPTPLTATSIQGTMIPSVRVDMYDDDDEEKGEEMEVDQQQEFNSQSPIKFKISKLSQKAMRPERPTLFISKFATGLPAPDPRLMTKDMNRALDHLPQSASSKVKSEGVKEEEPYMDFSRWQATLMHNPVYKLVRKASKCLTTSEWNTAIQDLIFFQTFERIDQLKAANQWSFLQPKRQVIPTIKDHWSYLLDEAKWMHADFKEERKWKRALAMELAQAAVEWHRATPQERVALRGYYQAPPVEDFAEPIERGVPEQEEIENKDDETTKVPEVVEMLQEAAEQEPEPEPEVVVAEPQDVKMQEDAKDPAENPESAPEPEFTLKTEETDGPSLGDLAMKDEEGNPIGPPIDETKNPLLYEGPGDQKREDEDNHVLVQQTVTELDSSALWVEPTELEKVVHTTSSGEKTTLRQTWEMVFPELPVYEMPDPFDPITSGQTRHRKDEVQTDTIPISRYTDSNPLILSVLQPSTHLDQGSWTRFDSEPVKKEEGDPFKYINEGPAKPRYEVGGAFINNCIAAGTRSVPWFPAEDALLKRLVPELLYNWQMIADAFNFYNYSNDMEKRTPGQCLVRYDLLFGDDEQRRSPAPFPEGRLKPFPPGRRPKQVEEFCPTAGPTDDDAKFMRHKFVHRAIKRMMKRREEEAKAREGQQRVMMPHQSHDAIMKYKVYTPQELGRIRKEGEDKRIAEMKRRQMEIRQQTEAKFRQVQAAAGLIPGGPIPMQPIALNGPNMPINGAPGMLPVRLPGGVPNISQQANANIASGIARGPNGEAINPMNPATLMLLQQQQRLNATAAAMANGTSPRPQSAASILSQAQAAMGGTPPQAHMMNPLFRQMQATAMAQQISMSSMSNEQVAMFRQHQQALAQRAAAQQMAANLQQQQQQQQQNASQQQQPQNPPPA